MRHVLASKDFRQGFVEMLPACVGLVPFGLVCGVGAAAAGANWLGSLGMSAIIFSGAAQIVAAQMLAADAPFAVIVLTTTVLGLRLLMYSAAIAPYLKPLPERWQRALAFLLVGPGVRRGHPALPHGRRPRGRGRTISWAPASRCGWRGRSRAWPDFFAGNLIPSAWSLEFAVPLCFIALVAPLFRDTPSVLAAITAGIAVLALAHLPMKLNLIVGRPSRHRHRHARRPCEGAMEAALKLWAVIFAVGALNYLSRLSFIAFFAKRSMPPLLARALKLRAGRDAHRARSCRWSWTWLAAARSRSRRPRSPLRCSQRSSRTS